MRKELFVLTIMLLTFGIIMNFSLVLAENNLNVTSVGAVDNGSENYENQNETDGEHVENNSNVTSVGAVDNGSENYENQNETDKEKVCCHIFGYGANMEKVNSRYELMEREECVVAEDWVGGGREIVAKVRCKGGYAERIQAAVQARNRLKFENKTGVTCPEGCFCRGVVMTCDVENGTKKITIYAQSGNVIVINVGGVNTTTNATLYHHNGKIYGAFKNKETNESETKEVRILPDQVRKRIRERTRARLNNTNITLNENGEYECRAEKEARFLGLFRVRERVRWNIDAETGEIIREKGPWWGFLARDVVEAEEERLSNEEILEAIMPGMDEFCQYLDDNAKNSSCATCQINKDNYELVNSLEGNLPHRAVWYTINRTGENYIVQVRAYVIYGRNTRMGSKQATFILDKEGNIIDKKFPESTCL